jgi:hypothetical protein
LSQIDKELISKKYNYIRFIDDYYCYCESKEQAERFIQDLTQQLDNYKLSLNSKKTYISTMPKLFYENWVHKIGMIDIPSNILSFDHIRNFLDLGVELSNKE